MSALAGRLEQAVRTVMSAVDRTVASADTMYHGNDPHYFAVAADALKAMLAALESAGRATPRRVLDFGCGYGRVMRTMRAAFPEAELLACDVDEEGAAHCAAAFGATALESSADLARLPRVRDVDLIWCGSVFTHLDAPQWARLLGYFSDVLAEGGVAVITTHGKAAAARLEHHADYGLEPAGRAAVLASYGASGFGYHDYVGHIGFGVSLSAPDWVFQQVARCGDLRTIGYLEAGWDGHQDVLKVVKDRGR